MQSKGARCQTIMALMFSTCDFLFAASIWSLGDFFSPMWGKASKPAMRLVAPCRTPNKEAGEEKRKQQREKRKAMGFGGGLATYHSQPWERTKSLTFNKKSPTFHVFLGTYISWRCWRSGALRDPCNEASSANWRGTGYPCHPVESGNRAKCQLILDHNPVCVLEVNQIEVWYHYCKSKDLKKDKTISCYAFRNRVHDDHEWCYIYIIIYI